MKMESLPVTRLPGWKPFQLKNGSWVSWLAGIRMRMAKFLRRNSRQQAGKGEVIGGSWAASIPTKTDPLPLMNCSRQGVPCWMLAFRGSWSIRMPMKMVR
jgi:hypothetical protein